MTFVNCNTYRLTVSTHYF